MSKLGVHISAGNRRGFGDFLKQCYDAGSPVPVIFSVDQDIWPDVERFSPSTLVVFRHQNKQGSTGGQDGPGDAYAGDPVQSARTWMAANMPVWRLNTAHYYAPLNEQDPGTLAGFAWLNAFTLECIRIADESGFLLALYAFSAGNPKDGLDSNGQILFTLEQAWHELLPSLVAAKRGGHILLLHEYGFDSPAVVDDEGHVVAPNSSLRASAPNLALRYRRSLRYLHKFNADPKVVIAEASAGVGAFGGLSHQAWVADAAWYDAELMKDAAVIGCGLYQLGGAENLREALPLLTTYISKTKTPAPLGDPVIDDGTVITPPPADDTVVRVAHLGPQDATLAEMQLIQAAAYPQRQTVAQSAHDARDLVRLGAAGSKAIVWEPQRWHDDIVSWLAVPTEIRHFTAPPPATRVLLDVPYLSQLDVPNADYAPGDCGTADVAMWLGYLGQRVTVDDVSAATGKASGFTLLSVSDIKKSAAHFGLMLRHESDRTITEIKSEIDAGRPVMVLINYAALPAANKYDANYKHGHFWLVVGYTANELIYNDPYWRGTDGRNRTIGLADFDRAWSTPCADFTYLRQALLGGDVVPQVNVDFKAGVGTGNPQLLTTTELEAIRISRVGAVKLLTLADGGEMRTTIEAVRRVRPDALLVARLFYKPDAHKVHRFDAAEFVATVAPGLSAAYAAGVRDFEVHNEPNLEVEGNVWNWADGVEFGAWLHQVLSILRPRYPGARFGYPGLSPQPNALNFWAQSRSAALACDWIGVHAYWQTKGSTGWGMTSIDGGFHWTRARSMFPSKMLMVTEFSNNCKDVEPGEKGREYALYFDLLAHEPNVSAGFAFALSWPGDDDNHEAWVNGKSLTGIPIAVGGAMAVARMAAVLRGE